MNKHYDPPQKDNWKGRKSSGNLYIHEKVQLTNLMEDLALTDKSVAILGYASDEGVGRNQGRIGASKGPDAIRKVFSKMPVHLPDGCELFDLGNLVSENGDMEALQNELAEQIKRIREKKGFCIVLGGGHDLAYGHYHGLKNSLREEAVLGIINFDAHFDLRSNANGNNSGTPFYQIGKEFSQADKPFPYLCLGIRKDANDRALYDSASVFGVNYLEIERFQINQLELISREIEYFLNRLDAVYVTIDLDGFSSAYAPGVSAPSPMGFTPELVIECLKTIIYSKKLIGLDIAEMNPEFDRDQQTARLAASLMHFAIHRRMLL